MYLTFSSNDVFMVYNLFSIFENTESTDTWKQTIAGILQPDCTAVKGAMFLMQE